MNKKSFVDRLEKETNYSLKQCENVNDVLGSHLIIGKNNKIKIVNDFKDKLEIDDEEADKLYNLCVAILGSEFKTKIRHPFKSKKK